MPGTLQQYRSREGCGPKKSPTPCIKSVRIPGYKHITRGLTRETAFRDETRLLLSSMKHRMPDDTTILHLLNIPSQPSVTHTRFAITFSAPEDSYRCYCCVPRKTEARKRQQVKQSCQVRRKKGSKHVIFILQLGQDWTEQREKKRPPCPRTPWDRTQP